MKNFRDLKVWQRSHLFTLEVYKCTRGFPKHEIYTLVSQMRRSASSIPTNIAEGCGRKTDGDFARFLDHSMGSASELEYQLLLSRDLEYIDLKPYEKLSSELVEIRRMLNALIQKVRGNAQKS